MARMGRDTRKNYALCAGRNMELLEERIQLEDALAKHDYKEADRFLRILKRKINLPCHLLLTEFFDFFHLFGKPHHLAYTICHQALMQIIAVCEIFLYGEAERRNGHFYHMETARAYGRARR